MPEIPDGRIGAVREFAPLPPFTTAEDILADALPMLDPPSRISVTEAAERYIRVPVSGAWGAFDRDVTPYMVEPSDMTQSRRFRAIVFTGPSQTGKTMMLQSTAMHAVTCDQEEILVVHMTKGDRDKWVEQKLDPMIANSPELAARLGKGRDDSTFSRKRFRGMRMMIGYPTPTVLSGGTYRKVLLTDYDHMPQVLGGRDNPEGSPFRMALNRIRTHMSRGCVLVESSPAWPVIDPGWRPRPEAPHKMPPVAVGIVPLYNAGTRGRWMWECPDCAELFEPRIDRLHYDDSLDPGAAGASALMECPHCGSLIAHRHKVELNRRALRDRGGWRHEAGDGALVAIDDPAVRQTDTASYALNGAAATFASWSEIVAHLEEARRKAETLGDETDLATVYYTEIGVPFRRERAGDNQEIGPQFLRDHAQETAKGIAPAWTRFVTVAVDVQGTRFVVQAMAWGAGGTSQIIDRFDLITPPDGAPNRGEGESQRALDPGRYREDWDVLGPLADRVYAVEGHDHGIRPLAVVVDFHGAAGVSDNAEKFWRAQAAAGRGRSWFLSRGHGGLNLMSRVWYETPERGSKGKKARSIRLLNFATDRLKDTVWAALGKLSGRAEGALYPASWLTDAEIEELDAEERDDRKGWRMKQGRQRNETFDLCAMNRALAEHFGLNRIDWDAPPAWCVAGPTNTRAEMGEDEAAAPARPRPGAARDGNWIPDRGDWL